MTKYSYSCSTVTDDGRTGEYERVESWEAAVRWCEQYQYGGMIRREARGSDGALRRTEYSWDGTWHDSPSAAYEAADCGE